MLKTIVLSVLAYIATNIDDIFIITLLFASAYSAGQYGRIIAGRYIGMAILTGVSLIGSGGIRAVAESYTHLLGAVPLIMGVKEIYTSVKKHSDSHEQSIKSTNIILTSAGMTIASGGDNIGIYLPLIANMNITEICLLCLVFAVMTGLWCLAGYYIIRIPFIHKILKKYKNIVVPVVYILLGLYILV